MKTRFRCADEPRRLLAAVALVVAALGIDGIAWSQTGADWKLGTSEEKVSWTSGQDDDLSQWKTVDCHGEFGERFALVGLIGHKEPSLNLDSFIARLKAICANLDRTSTHTKQVFTSKDHRETPSTWIAATGRVSMSSSARGTTPTDRCRSRVSSVRWTSGPTPATTTCRTSASSCVARVCGRRTT
jgi:hypothetical protein